MDIINKLKKLRRMSAKEVRSRLGGQLRKRTERRRWRNATRSIRVHSDGLLDRCRQLVPGTLAQSDSELQTDFPSYYREFSGVVRSHADKICNGHWRMLGHDFDLRDQVQWNADPCTGYQWDSTFYGDLPLYSAPGERDVKYPWELSRHQFLVELGFDLLLNGEHQSATRVRELLLDWIAKNRVYEGINWTSALEVSMRSTSWIWSLAATTDWQGWTDEDLQAIAESLYDHGDYLAHHFSFYSSPYNHLIGEAAGLLAIATLFLEQDDQVGEHARRWYDLACRVLLEFGPKQFYQDHFCVEQATGYHYFTLGFLLLGYSASRRSGSSTKLEGLREIIQNGFKTGALFRRADGTWPSIGDLDSARSFPLKPANDWCFDSLHSAASVLLDDPSLKTCDSPGQELYWLTGVEGLRKFESGPKTKATQRTGLLKDSGYVIAGGRKDLMIFDAGSVSHGLFPDATPSTAHGHADTLQVIYDLDGERMLEDAGMPFYGGEPEWVKHFRSTAAHNTVAIEGAPFVQWAGRLAWSHEVERPEIDAEFHRDAWLAFGKVVWPEVVHERSVCCIPGEGMWIADWIKTQQPRGATWYWQLPNTSMHDDGKEVRWGDRYSMRCDTIGAKQNRQLTSAEPSSPKGWRCFGYGERSPANQFSIDCTIQKELLVLTSIGRIDRRKLVVQTREESLPASNNPETPEQRLLRFRGFSWSLPQPQSVIQ